MTVMINKISMFLCIPILFLKLVGGIVTLVGSIVTLFGGIVAGIWLAFLGEWMLFFIGFIFLITGQSVIILLLSPTVFFAPIAINLHERGNLLAYLLFYFSQFYTNLIIVGTFAFAFFVCTYFYDVTSDFGVIPYLLWSWGMALGPWQLLQLKEQGNEFSAITLSNAIIFYFLFLISIFLGAIYILLIITLFLFIQLVFLPLFFTYIGTNMKNCTSSKSVISLFLLKQIGR